MARPTEAGMKILKAFEQRHDDQFTVKELKYENILIRSRMRSVNLYRSTDKLVTDGFLHMRYSHSGRFFSLTDAGRAALANTPTK